MTEAIVYGLPVLIYLVVQSHRRRLGLRTALYRLGCTPGRVTDYVLAVGLGAVQLALFLVVVPAVPVATLDSPGMVFPVASTVSVAAGVVLRAVMEELLFRGLIAGVLQQRWGLLRGNLVQAAVFLLPHLILLAVDLRAWPILIMQFLSALLLGWLRHRSNSFLPGAVAHAAANLLAPVLAQELL